MEDATAWQNRPLETTYAIVYFDALRVKIRDEGMVRNKAIYLAIGVTWGGAKEVLGLWIEQTEGTKFWMRVMSEIRNRGTRDILVAVVDGLKGFPDYLHLTHHHPPSARPTTYASPSGFSSTPCKTRQIKSASTAESSLPKSSPVSAG